MAIALGGSGYTKSSGTLPTYTGFTSCAWIRLTTDIATSTSVGLHGIYDSGGRFFRIYAFGTSSTTTSQIRFFLEAVEQWNQTTALELDVWTFIAVTVADSSYTINAYHRQIDDTSFTSNTFSNADSSRTITEFRFANSSTDFAGDLGDWRIYEEELSEEALWNESVTTFPGRTANLYGHYAFRGSDFTIDRSGNGNDLGSSTGHSETDEPPLWERSAGSLIYMPAAAPSTAIPIAALARSMRTQRNANLRR